MLWSLTAFACEAAPVDRGAIVKGASETQATATGAGAGPGADADAEAEPPAGGLENPPSTVLPSLPRVPLRTPTAAPSDPAAAGACPKASDKSLGVITSPRRPWAGGRLHVLAATFDGAGPLEVRVEHDDEPVEVAIDRRDGPPSSAAVTFRPEDPGVYRVIVGRAGVGLACRKIRVGSRRKRSTEPELVTPSEDGTLARAWKTRRSWRPREEALFSAWVRELFHAPRGE